MDYAHWWGPHVHWFWIMPFLFMILMCILATRRFRRTGDWRWYGWWKCGQHPMEYWWSGTPRQILDKRYAGGEITKEQYERMKRDIESSPAESESKDEGS